MKTLLKGVYAFFMAALVLAGCQKPVEEEPVTIRLNKTLISSLPVGSTQTLTATIAPEGVKVTVVWSSEDDAVAVVNENGEVTGVAPGTTVISARAEESVATCKVTVTEVKPTAIKLSAATLKLAVEEHQVLEVVLTPSNAVADDLTWSTSDEKVAVVDQNGTVTALAEGNATITVKCNGGNLAATCQVEVVSKEEEVKVTAIALEPASLSLEEGQKGTLNIVVTPANAVVEDLQWETSDAEVASISAGEVTAIKAGKAVITAKCNAGALSATCQITVTEKAVTPPDEDAVKSVVIFAEGDASDIQVGKTVQLTARYEPSTAKPKSVSWTVDRADYAQVDQNGLVEGIYTVKGSDKEWPKVTVTLTADGVSSSVSLRVIPPQPESIEVDLPQSGSLKVGEQWDFNPRVIPSDLGYGVVCSIMMPGNNFIASPVVSSAAPGTMNAQFAVASNDNLVYSSYRKDVSLNVYPYWVETISLPQAQETSVGMTLNLMPVFTSDVEGIQPTYKDVKWTSSNPSVAKVDERTGEITALSAGVANITATTAHDWSVPSGSAQKTATCELTVKAEEGNLNVGDFYYSDGTWSSELDPSKEVIGVIFAKANATTSDPLLARDYPGCTHGLVISTQEYTQQAFGSVSCYNGHGYYAGLGYDAASIVDTDKPNGYGNTLAHAALNASKPDYCTLFNAADGVLAQHAVAVPSTASAWYVPSYKEMSMINDSRDVVNASLQAAGGQKVADPYAKEESFDDNRSSDWYWTSTIYGVWYANAGTYDHYAYAFDISKGGWTTSQQPSAKCKVRVILAF